MNRLERLITALWIAALLFALLPLAHVLRKLSGLRDLESVPGIADALQRAPALLVTFYYRTIEHPMPDGAVRTELRLMARFAEPGVDDLGDETLPATSPPGSPRR